MRSFTLIEVLIAVIVLVVSSVVFIESVANSKRLILFYLNLREDILKSSIIINQKVVTNAYESLIDYKIDNDFIIRELKKYKTKIKVDRLKNVEVFRINNITYYKMLNEKSF